MTSLRTRHIVKRGMDCGSLLAGLALGGLLMAAPTVTAHGARRGSSHGPDSARPVLTDPSRPSRPLPRAQVLRPGAAAEPIAAPEPVEPTPEVAAAGAWCGENRDSDDLQHEVANGSGKFHVIYAYPADYPNRLNQLASYLQWSSLEASNIVARTHGRALRYDLGTSCGPVYVDISAVRLSRTAAQLDRDLGNPPFWSVANELSSRGFNSPDKNYLVFLDSPERHYCGEGAGYGDNTRGSSNLNQGGGRYAIVYRPFDPANSAGGFCGGAALHEELHVLGAVPPAAPHNDGSGHCNDAREDIMCGNAPSRGGGPYVDWGEDDYWDPPGGQLGWWAVNLSRYICPTSGCNDVRLGSEWVAPTGEVALPSSSSRSVTVSVRNTSSVAWQRGQVNLHFVDPQGNDISPYPYCGDSPEWRGGRNAVFFRGEQVAPGAIAHYDVRICGQPGYEGPATLRLQSVMEGVAHFGSVYPLYLRFAPPAAPALDVAVRLFNGDDTQQVAIGANEVASGGYGESRTISLGRLDDQDRITWTVRNAGSGYTWGFELIVNGQVVYRDVEGQAGVEGANGNDQARENQVVRRVVLNATGQVVDSYEARTSSGGTSGSAAAPGGFSTGGSGSSPGSGSSTGGGSGTSTGSGHGSGSGGSSEGGSGASAGTGQPGGAAQSCARARQRLRRARSRLRRHPTSRLRRQVRRLRAEATRICDA